MNFLKTLPVFFIFLFFVPSSTAAIILKVKNKQALIHLEGIKTRKGSYFEAVDLYGRKKGIVQIKRIGQKKAIGVLKLGHMEQRWSLEPTSKKKAIAAQKKAKRRTKIARIPKEKIKRKFIAAKKKLKKHKRTEKKRKLAKRRKPKKRSVASYKKQQEYILKEISKQVPPEETLEHPNYQSQEVLSSDTLYGESNLTSENQTEQNKDPGLKKDPKSSSKRSKRFMVGVAPRVEYNFMKIVPPDGDPEFLMKGLGLGFFVFTDFVITPLIRTGGNFGFKQFNASASQSQCGNGGGCQLAINYLSAGLNIKVNAIEFDKHQFWLALEWNGMMPVSLSNNAPLDQESFGFPFHGSLGAVLGADLSIGKFTIPVSLRGSIYIPPTATAMVFVAGLQVGAAYKF